MPITTLEPTPSHKRLRLFSAISAGLALVQLVLAVFMMSMQNHILGKAHEGVAFLVLLAAVLTAVPAYYWGKLSRDTALFPVALGVAGATIAQLVLGFAGSKSGGGLIISHMVLGVLIPLGAFYLHFLARKMPIVVTNVDGTKREQAPRQK